MVEQNKQIKKGNKQMKILQASNGITKVQLYNIQKEASEKMKDAAGEPLKIAFWALGEREGQDGDDYQVLLINDVNDIVYSTSSATFIAQFLEALEVFGELKAIEVQPKKSKRTGREYLALKVVE